MGTQVPIPSTHEKHLCVLVALMLEASGRQVPEDPASKNRSQKDVEEDSPLVTSWFPHMPPGMQVCKSRIQAYMHTQKF